MKKLAISIFLVLLAVCLFVGCSSSPVIVEENEKHLVYVEIRDIQDGGGFFVHGAIGVNFVDKNAPLDLTEQITVIGIYSNGEYEEFSDYTVKNDTITLEGPLTAVDISDPSIENYGTYFHVWVDGVESVNEFQFTQLT